MRIAICFITLFFAARLFADTAFVDVTLVPMDVERIVEHQTVIVSNGRITKMGHYQIVDVPDEAERIEGKGLFLLPGFIDMHVHIGTRQDLLLWLMNGVTTVRNMRGGPLHLRWKQLIETGSLQGPRIFTCGPSLEGEPPTGEYSISVLTAAEAEEAIKEQKEAGYDCIKVYNRLAKETYDAIIRSARKHGVPVTGHVPKAVGLEAALVARQDSIEHLSGYMAALKPEESAQIEGEMPVDEAFIGPLAEATKKNGVFNCPTLIVQKNFVSASLYKQFLNRPEMKYVPPLRVLMWDPAREERFRTMTRDDFVEAERGLEILEKITRALRNKGAKVLLGTDAPSRLVIPGFSAHEELSNLVDAGLTPFEALRAATTNPAEMLGMSKQIGRIAPGYAADLLLIEGDPLKSIHNTSRIHGVMARGRWFSIDKINEILASVPAGYKHHSDRFAEFRTLPRDQGFSGVFEAFDTNLPLGAERIIVHLEKGEIIGQQSSDPPFDGKYEMQIVKRSPDEMTIKLFAERFELTGMLEAKLSGEMLNIRARMPFHPLVNKTIPVTKGTILDSFMLATKFQLADQFKQLAVGSKITVPVQEFDFFSTSNKPFTLQEKRWFIQRQSDITRNRQTYRSFVVHAKNRYATSIYNVLTDESGIIVEWNRDNRRWQRSAK